MILGEETKLKWLLMCMAYYVNSLGVKTKTCNKPCLTVCMLSFYPNCDKQHNKKCEYNRPKICNYSEEYLQRICFINMIGYMLINIKFLSNFLSHVFSRELCVSVSTVLTFWEWLPKSLCFHFHKHFMHCVEINVVHGTNNLKCVRVKNIQYQ